MNTRAVSDSVKLIPSGYTGLTSLTQNNSYPITRGYTDSSSTNYARFTLPTSTTGYIYYTFNTSALPADATITSVAANFKARVGNTSRVTGTGAQLYSGTTAKGSSTAFASTSASVRAMTPGSWTRSEMNDLRIRVTATGSSSTSEKRFDFYGADVTINYSYNITTYDVNSSITGTGSISPSGNTEVDAGDSYQLTISDVSSISSVLDNNVNVTSQLVQVSSATSTLVPESYTNGTTAFTLTNIANAYTDATSTTSATLTAAGGGTARSIYLELGDLNLPSGSTITGVTCSATFQFSRNNSSSGVSASCQLYSGNTAKGSSTTIVSSATDLAKTTFNLTPGSWTASEIANARLFITMTNSASSTQRMLYVYGVSFNVTYTVSGNVYTYTINNVSADHNIVVNTGAAINVTGVSLNKNTESVQENQTVTLTATVTPSNATNQNVTWSSSNTTVATVSNGVVSGLTPGTATITVTTVDGGYTATCLVTVTAEPSVEYVLTYTMVPGQTYLVANGNSGSVYLMSNQSGGTRILTGVSATVSNNRITLKESVAEKCAFNCVLTDSNNSITTTLESDSKYLYCDNSSGLRFQASNALDRFWHYQDNKFWQFKNSSSDGYTDTSSEYKYYLELNNGNFTDNHVTTTSIEDSTLPAIYLFTPSSSASTSSLYFKNNGTWVEAVTAYKKINGTWVIQSDLSAVFQNGINYLRG